MQSTNFLSKNSTMSVSVYETPFYNSALKRDEKVEFIYIGLFPQSSSRAHVIIVNIGKPNAQVVIQPGWMIDSIIGNTETRKASLLDVIIAFKQVQSVPQRAANAFKQRLDDLLEQYSQEQFRIKSGNKIANACFRAYFDPEYSFCKHRMIREFRLMQSV
jgi:hypothetical protein